MLQRSIFDRLPGEGRWATALLLDGNVGIGGDAARLRSRLRELLRPGGCVFAELAPPDVHSCVRRMRVESRGHASAWFAWAVVSTADIEEVADHACFAVVEQWSAARRWFVELRSQ